MKSDRLQISEIFGPTIQGEGPSAGRSSVFVRLGRCNLSCSWCDTRYSWDAERFDLNAELTQLSVQDVCQEVLARRAKNVVITGGEPLLHKDQLVPLVSMLKKLGRAVEFETNGTISPGSLREASDLFVVSPKLGNSNLSAASRLRPRAMREFSTMRNACFKFVVSSVDDFEEVDEVVGRFGLPLGAIWIMPEATSHSRLVAGMRDMVDEVTRRGWNLSSRMQITLWENERGR